MAQLTKEELGAKLLRYFKGDRARVKSLADGCKSIGFPLAQNMDAISKHPEHFLLLVSYSDLGILTKLKETLDILKG